MSFLAILIIVLIYGCFIWSFIAAGLATRLGRDEQADGWAISAFFFGPLVIAILYAKGRAAEPKTFFLVTEDERRKWEALCRGDRHIALAAAKAKDVSESCERDLMLMYFAVNDRQQLPHLLMTAIDAAEIRKRVAVQAQGA